MKKRYCIDCGDAIPRHFIGRRCSKCLIDALDSTKGSRSDHYYTTKDIADIFGFTSEEYVRRLSRKGLFPGRIPTTGQHLFFRSTINQFVKQNQTPPKIPSSPLQEEARSRCQEDDHDWLFEERFEGIAYTVLDDVT